MKLSLTYKEKKKEPCNETHAVWLTIEAYTHCLTQKAEAGHGEG